MFQELSWEIPLFPPFIHRLKLLIWFLCEQLKCNLSLSSLFDKKAPFLGCYLALCYKDKFLTSWIFHSLFSDNRKMLFMMWNQHVLRKVFLLIKFSTKNCNAGTFLFCAFIVLCVKVFIKNNLKFMQMFKMFFYYTCKDV